MHTSLAHRLSVATLAAFALLALSSCASGPELTDVWTAPDVSKLNFKKIMVIAATQDAGLRRVAEDAMGGAITQVQCIPSYAFLPGDLDMKDAKQISGALKDAGFDGIVTMRMISDRDEVNVTYDMGYPMYPAGYGTFGGYYGRYAMTGYGYGGYGYGAGYGPGYASTTVTTDRIISIETSIFEYPSEKLVWSGVTTVTSPENIRQLIDDSIGAIRKELAKQGLIPTPAK